MYIEPYKVGLDNIFIADHCPSSTHPLRACQTLSKSQPSGIHLDANAYLDIQVYPGIYLAIVSIAHSATPLRYS